MTIKTVVHQMNKSVFWRLIAFSLQDFLPKTLNFASSNQNYYECTVLIVVQCVNVKINELTPQFF